MFTTHFQLSAHPFIEPIPTDRVFHDERITEGLARLEYFKEHGTIALVTGTTGVGKSTLIHSFMNNLNNHRFRHVYIHFTHMKSNAVLNLIVTQLGEVPRRGKDRLFMQILNKTNNTDAVTVLIIDEAQFIQPDTLIDLRLLVSSVKNEKASLKILLTGQEHLRELLKQDRHADLVHRIAVRYHLHPLTPEQTAAYIDHQLAAVGGNHKIFETEAKRLIHDYTNGIPRQINNVATAAMILAASTKSKMITDLMVNQTMEEFRTA